MRAGNAILTGARDVMVAAAMTHFAAIIEQVEHDTRNAQPYWVERAVVAGHSMNSTMILCCSPLAGRIVCLQSGAFPLAILAIRNRPLTTDAAIPSRAV
jgi:hypothetical protein